MEPTFIVSELDAVMASCLAQGVHFVTFLAEPRACCRICGTTWGGVEAYALDSGVCPGYATSAQEPAMLPSQPPVRP